MSFFDEIRKYFYGWVAQKETIENMGLALSRIAMAQAVAGDSHGAIHGIKAAAIHDELMARGGEPLVDNVYFLAMFQSTPAKEQIWKMLPLSQMNCIPMNGEVSNRSLFLINGSLSMEVKPVTKSPVIYATLHPADIAETLRQRPFSAMLRGGVMSTLASLLTGRSRASNIADDLLDRLTPGQKRTAVINLARSLNEWRLASRPTVYDSLFKRDGLRRDMSVVAPILSGITAFIFSAAIYQPQLSAVGAALAAVGVLMMSLHIMKSIQRDRKYDYLDDVLCGRVRPPAEVFFAKFPPVEMAGVTAILETMSRSQVSVARLLYPDMPVTEAEMSNYKG